MIWRPAKRILQLSGKSLNSLERLRGSAGRTKAEITEDSISVLHAYTQQRRARLDLKQVDKPSKSKWKTSPPLEKLLHNYIPLVTLNSVPSQTSFAVLLKVISLEQLAVLADISGFEEDQIIEQSYMFMETLAEKCQAGLRLRYIWMENNEDQNPILLLRAFYPPPLQEGKAYIEISL